MVSPFFQDLTEDGFSFDQRFIYARDDFKYLLGMRYRKARRYIGTKGFDLRCIGVGPKRYAMTMDYMPKRVNVAVSRWRHRIIYVDGIY